MDFRLLILAVTVVLALCGSYAQDAEVAAYDVDCQETILECDDTDYTPSNDFSWIGFLVNVDVHNIKTVVRMRFVNRYKILTSNLLNPISNPCTLKHHAQKCRITRCQKLFDTNLLHFLCKLSL